MIRGGKQALVLAGFAAMSGTALAQGLDAGPGITMPGGEKVVIEPFVGYLRGTATEYVYDPISKRKVSQLDWNANATTVGGRVAFGLMDGLAVRGRFWSVVSGDANMRDRDWLYGYNGNSSWSEQSLHPQTSVSKAWQADVSLAYTVVQAGDVAVAALAGYRHYEIKYRATGGSYIYSGLDYRDTTGNFTPGQLGISYQQWWDTPYLGIGTYYRSNDFSLSMELYGSPVSYSRDRDYHALRYTLFKEKFQPLGMVGASLGLEYQITPMFSVAGRLDYTRYSEQKGGTRMIDYAAEESYRFPKPSAGADSDTLHLTLGVKGKI